MIRRGLFALVAVTAACARAGRVGVARSAGDAACRGPAVPAVAPDSIPRALYTAEAITSSAPDLPGSKLVRGIALVLFHRGTPQADRQAAVDAVCGTVVGGRRTLGDDGEYIVRVPLDATGRGLLAALRRLNAMPQVAAAAEEAFFVTDPRPR